MKYIICTVIVIFIGSCDTDKPGDFYVPTTIEGTIYLEDTILETPSKIARETTVYLSKNTTIDEPHLFEAKTDKEGKFKFEFKPEDGIICIIGKYTETDKIIYTNAVRVDEFSRNPKLILSPRYPRGKIKVTVKDASMQPVNGVEVYLFVNQSLAGSVAAGNPNGFIKKETTNENGIAFFYDLGPKDYYVAGRREKQWFAIQKTTTSAGDNDFTTINPIDATISTPASPIQLTITIQDAQQKPMFGSEVFIFTSEKQAETAKSAKKPTGAIATQLTNVNGKASFNALEYNKDYFVIARDSLFDAAIMITPTIRTQMKAAYSVIMPVKTNSKGDPEVEPLPLIIRL